MKGYWENPEETDRSDCVPGRMSGKRVLHTGDLFRTDDEGYLYFVGRKDDMIKSRGEKVSPKEIEDVLYSIDGVAEAAWTRRSRSGAGTGHHGRDRALRRQSPHRTGCVATLCRKTRRLHGADHGHVSRDVAQDQLEQDQQTDDSGVTIPFSASVLDIDAAACCLDIETAIRHQIFHVLRRRGVVVGLSGGVDSSVVASLCVRALGADRVFALFMPERDSTPESLTLGRLMAAQLGVASATECITPMLIAAGCYQRRDEAIREVIPQYDEHWKSSSSRLGNEAIRYCSVVAESPDGLRTSARLGLHAYLAVVAATSFKQRVRKILEYYHADRLNHAVAGTANRLEDYLGFFVKCGDGAADLKPIAHLYKRQVYQLAEWLGVPEEIRSRPPTTDTIDSRSLKKNSLHRAAPQHGPLFSQGLRNCSHRGRSSRWAGTCPRSRACTPASTPTAGRRLSASTAPARLTGG